MPWCVKKEKAPKPKKAEGEEKKSKSKKSRDQKAAQKANDTATDPVKVTEQVEPQEESVNSKTKKDKKDKKDKKKTRASVEAEQPAQSEPQAESPSNAKPKDKKSKDKKQKKKHDSVDTSEESRESASAEQHVEAQSAPSVPPLDLSPKKDKQKDKQDKSGDTKEAKSPRSPKSTTFADEVPGQKSPLVTSNDQEPVTNGIPIVTTSSDATSSTVVPPSDGPTPRSGRRSPRNKEAPSSEIITSRHGHSASYGGHTDGPEPLLSPKSASPTIQPSRRRPNPFNRGSSAFAPVSLPTTPRSARQAFHRSLGRERSSSISHSEWIKIQTKADSIVSAQRHRITERQSTLRSAASSVALAAQKEAELMKKKDHVATLDDLDDLEDALDTEVASIASFRPEDYNEQALEQAVLEQAIKEHMEEDIMETKRVLEAMQDDQTDLNLNDLEGLDAELDLADPDAIAEEDEEFDDVEEENDEHTIMPQGTAKKDSSFDSTTESTHTDRTPHRTSSALSDIDSVSNSARSVDPVA